MSATAGLPTWSQLRTKLLAAAQLKQESIDAADRDALVSRLQSAQDTTDSWVAMQLLKDCLGDTSFNAEIRDALGPADTAQPPELYRMLWRLNLSGLLTLNLDRFAEKAFSLEHPGHSVNPFLGRDAGQSVQLLKSPHPFIANLHGTVTDASSWVFCSDQLSALLKNPGYNAFLEACFATRTVVFVGVTPDDIAVRHVLERLKVWGVDTGTHYWITHRGDQSSDKWAEGVGIQVIRYRLSGDDHADLTRLLNNIHSFVPKDDSPPPISVPTEGTPTPIPSPSDLAARPADEIRRALNVEAAHILAPNTTDAYSDYDAFCKRFDVAIYRAWYASCTPPDNILLGFTLEAEVERGAFGRVFRGRTPKGDSVAIKVLHEDARRTKGMLEGFRRGVRAMSILSKRNIHGMVPYLEASEIPAFVVMEFVEGPNLQQAVEARSIEEWTDILRVSGDLARIINAAHGVPEHVLHRDIRPPNVMLRGHFENPDTSEVVVLDFDLSWHRGAVEKSIAASATYTGYLAPEQVFKDPDTSSRNSLVDSFGMGMTLYFMRTRTHPHFEEHLQQGWDERVAEKMRVHECGAWQSLPRRFGRLVVRCTREKQTERWDMGQIARELTRLHQAIKSPESVTSAELLAEEVMARSQLKDRYRWDEVEMCARHALPSGIVVRVSGRDSERTVRLDAQWTSRGTADRKKVNKWIRAATEKVGSLWRREGITIEAARGSGGEVVMQGQVPAKDAVPRLDGLARSVDAAVAGLAFD